jgi:hypothetical protein
MRHITLLAALAGAFFFASPAAADQAAACCKQSAACCEQAAGCCNQTASCCDQAAGCCKHAHNDAIAVLLSLDQPGPAAPIRQSAVARFWNPVLVGDRVLMGKYIIEHDTDRMAKGLPCTHIYDFYTRKLVMAFHCTHLTGPETNKATVTIVRQADYIPTLTAFQFANEKDAHGVPDAR